MTTLNLDRRQLLLGAVGAAFAPSTRAKAHNGTVHVTIENLTFVPAEIEAKVGNTIEWVNKDPIAHTATVNGGWEVLIPPGATATRVVQAGDGVEYYCRFHPNMTGRIVIHA